MQSARMAVQIIEPTCPCNHAIPITKHGRAMQCVLTSMRSAWLPSGNASDRSRSVRVMDSTPRGRFGPGGRWWWCAGPAACCGVLGSGPPLGAGCIWSCVSLRWVASEHQRRPAKSQGAADAKWSWISWIFSGQWCCDKVLAARASVEGPAHRTCPTSISATLLVKERCFHTCRNLA